MRPRSATRLCRAAASSEACTARLSWCFLRAYYFTRRQTSLLHKTAMTQPSSLRPSPARVDVSLVGLAGIGIVEIALPGAVAAWLRSVDDELADRRGLLAARDCDDLAAQIAPAIEEVDGRSRRRARELAKSRRLGGTHKTERAPEPQHPRHDFACHVPLPFHVVPSECPAGRPARGKRPFCGNREMPRRELDLTQHRSQSRAVPLFDGKFDSTTARPMSG